MGWVLAASVDVLRRTSGTCTCKYSSYVIKRCPLCVEFSCSVGNKRFCANKICRYHWKCESHCSQIAVVELHKRFQVKNFSFIPPVLAHSHVLIKGNLYPSSRPGIQWTPSQHLGELDQWGIRGRAPLKVNLFHVNAVFGKKYAK